MRTVRGIAMLCLGEQRRSPLLGIGAGCLKRAAIQGDDALLASLAPQPQRALGPRDGINVECRKLRDAGTGGIKQLEHRRIAQPRGC